MSRPSSLSLVALASVLGTVVACGEGAEGGAASNGGAGNAAGAGGTGAAGGGGAGGGGVTDGGSGAGGSVAGAGGGGGVTGDAGDAAPPSKNIASLSGSSEPALGPLDASAYHEENQLIYVFTSGSNFYVRTGCRGWSSPIVGGAMLFDGAGAYKKMIHTCRAHNMLGIKTLPQNFSAGHTNYYDIALFPGPGGIVTNHTGFKWNSEGHTIPAVKDPAGSGGVEMTRVFYDYQGKPRGAQSYSWDAAGGMLPLWNDEQAQETVFIDARRGALGPADFRFGQVDIELWSATASSVSKHSLETFVTQYQALGALGGPVLCAGGKDLILGAKSTPKDVHWARWDPTTSSLSDLQKLPLASQARIVSCHGDESGIFVVWLDDSDQRQLHYWRSAAAGLSVEPIEHFDPSTLPAMSALLAPLVYSKVTPSGHFFVVGDSIWIDKQQPQQHAALDVEPTVQLFGSTGPYKPLAISDDLGLLGLYETLQGPEARYYTIVLE